MSNDQTIQLIQSPIIKHSLEEMGKSVSERLANLNLEKQIATEDTLKTLKDLRAVLNKECQSFEEQRKYIKNSVMDPYTEFETIYKTEILEKYKDADKTLKEKINDFEMSLKIEKKENLVKYFVELCEMEQIDWLTFDRLNIDINLSTSEKKYKVEIFGSVQKISDDISLISTESYAAEILVEYKQSLNASQAIQKVRQRKQDERLELERLNNERTSKRTFQLRSLSFIYHDFTRTYNWVSDETVMINYADVENLPDEEWIKRYADLEFKVKGNRDISTPPVLQAPTISVTTQEVPVQEAKEVVNEELFEAKFIVTANYAKLKTLSEYLKLNDYQYQNID